MAPNQLPLPQELAANVTYQLSASHRVQCPLCPGRTIRKHLKICPICRRIGCPACTDKKDGCLDCRKARK